MRIPRSQTGVGLVDALVATAITVVGAVGASALMIYGVHMQVMSRDQTAARAAAIQQLERLRILPATAVQKQVGGSLTANVANHFAATAPGFTTRWIVAAGPAGARDVTLVAVPANPNVRTAQVRALVWP